MIPNSTCSPNAVPCCTDYYEMAETIVVQVIGRISDCILSACNVPLVGAVLFSPDIVLADSLTFVINRVRTETRTVNNRPVKLSTTIMEGQIRLIESGYPVITDEGGRLVMPGLDEFERAAKHLIAHGQVLHKTLLGMRADGTIPNGCVFSRVGDLEPIDPESGLAGWSVNIEAMVF